MVMSSNEIIDEVRVDHPSLSNGRHILYTYNDSDKYLKNAVEFIEEGLVHHHYVIFLESKENFQCVKQTLKSKGMPEEKLEDIEFVDAIKLYNDHKAYGIIRATEELDLLIKSLVKTREHVRLWGNVFLSDHATILAAESACESFCNSHQQVVSVCAYNGNKIAAAVLTDLLRTHNYLMTDDSIVPSPLYLKDPESSPSIIEQIKRERTEENALIRSEQLSFAGQFAAGICHEIRNPLTTIKGFFQLIKEHKSNEKYFKVIEDELSRIEQITSELLLLAKPHSEHRQEQDLLSIINSVKVLLDAQAVMKSVTISPVFHAEEIVIDCEDTKIKQVLINIIKNAIEVMDNGEITIEAKVEKDKAVVAVADQGPGIPKEMLAKIGEPFFTTKEKGNGLGLLICFNIIKNHQGTIQIESEEGKGTNFIIRFPLVEAR